MTASPARRTSSPSPGASCPARAAACAGSPCPSAAARRRERPELRAGAASLTARLVCLFRALDQGHPHAILDDPFAERALGIGFASAARGLRAARPLLDVAAHGTLGLAGYVQARHRRLDELAQEAYDSGARQVVLLGAGFDARPWRFGRVWEGARVFVVDHPSTARARRESMAHLGAPDIDQVEVEVDFGREDLGARLLEAGFDPQAPAVFLWEGVSMYLPEAAVRTTLDTLARLAAPGSTLGFDLFRLPSARSLRDLSHRQALRVLGWIGEPVLFAVEPSAAPPLLQTHGWELVEALDHHALAARYRTDRRAIYAHAWVAIARRA